MGSQLEGPVLLPARSLQHGDGEATPVVLFLDLAKDDEIISVLISTSIVFGSAL
jgi:hypothetical protein